MAYLNVRERRIEAKIAYVGPPFAGKGTNFAHLRQVTRDPRIGRVDTSADKEGELLTVAWHPADRARFRDCDVLVKVVAHRGSSTDATLDDTLRDVDGVVLVVDAHPLAQTRNRASLAAVRGALARAERAAVPVVVQINKTDLEDALPASDVVSGLDALGLTHVAASAARGEGVVETLEAALNQVFAAMQRETESAAASAPGAAPAPPADRGAAETGHPLLAALRQVLRETVREHVAELEGRVMARIDASLVALSAKVESEAAASAELRKALREMADVLDEVSHRTTALTDRAHATFEGVRGVAAQLTDLRDPKNRSLD